MRVSLYTASRAPSPRNEALLHWLEWAGHEVSATRLHARRFGRERLVGFPAGGPYAGHGTPFEAGSEPSILFAATSRVVPEADRAAGQAGAWVVRRPDWPAPTRDLAWAAPARPELAVPGTGTVPETDPWNAHRGPVRPGAHAGRRIGLLYRSTPASPGHQLRAAMERAGIDVVTGDAIEAETDVEALVVVESPDPPLDVAGDPGVPVVYWVHHGEHHLEANLRLSRRYRADLVLLAHSWHLAVRFDRRVERFPFAVPPEVVTAGRPFAQRTFDAAFVGALEGSAYQRRRNLLDELATRVDSLEVRTGVAPAEMAELYGDARMVLNEGGTRHLPVTMRVFEAIGAGSLLVSEPAPGLDLLFADRYVAIDDDGIGLLPDAAEATRIADSAREEALAAHTYDHRVELLLRLLDGVEHEDRDAPASPEDPLDRFLDSHPHGQRILDALGIVDAPDREVWVLDDLSDVPRPGSFDTVVAGPDTDPAHIAAARRFVVGPGLDPGVAPAPVRAVEAVDDLVVIALDAPGYHVATVGGGPAV